MTTSRFDQKLGEVYGSCQTCGIELATEELLRAHLDATFAESPGEPGQNVSHTVLTTNPSREGRIRSAVDGLAQDAIADFIDGLEDLIGAGDITSEEADTAVAEWSDFANGWYEAGKND